jgi:hypothetical protein
MHISILSKNISTFILTLALVGGVVGFSSPTVAHAESEKSATSNAALVAELQKTLESLLRQLIALLEQQINNTDVADDDRNTLEIEATIFTNETIIKVEYNDDKQIIVTDADSRSEIINVILEEVDGLTRGEVSDALTIEEEDRKSRSSDKDDDFEFEDSQNGDELEIEVKIFTNETVVKVEYGDETTIFTTDATDRDDIIDEILDETTGLSREDIDDILEIEEEDRASRSSDKDDDSDDDENDDEDDDN